MVIKLRTRAHREKSKLLSRIVEERTSELKFANGELQDFAYIVSHDLKAPLRAVNQLVSWIVEDNAEAVKEKSKEHIDLLLNRIDRMDKLISGILLVVVGVFLVSGAFSRINVLFSAAPEWLSDVESGIAVGTTITVPLAFLAAQHAVDARAGRLRGLRLLVSGLRLAVRGRAGRRPDALAVPLRAPGRDPHHAAV